MSVYFAFFFSLHFIKINAFSTILKCCYLQTKNKFASDKRFQQSKKLNHHDFISVYFFFVTCFSLRFFKCFGTLFFRLSAFASRTACLRCFFSSADSSLGRAQFLNLVVASSLSLSSSLLPSSSSSSSSVLPCSLFAPVTNPLNFRFFFNSLNYQHFFMILATKKSVFCFLNMDCNLF